MVEYVIGMARIKAVALLLGPSGVGMIGLFNASRSLVGVVTGMGIGNAGVRQIAQSYGSGDQESVTRSALVLRRACWATGIFGWLMSAALCLFLSRWAFNDYDHAWLIAILGMSLLLTAVSSGQRALIQGTRRVADLARIAIISTSLGGITAIAIYSVWGTAGIVPALILSAAIDLATSWFFASKIVLTSADNISWKETIGESRKLVTLGVVFMWGALLLAVADMTIRGMVVREFGLEGSGVYQAAWALSGMFAGFVIGAMGTDFYPRLSGLGDDHQTINRVVNEQIEIGILLALPGLLMTLFCGPLVIIAFYSTAFAPAIELLPWYVLGVFVRVISWPVGFIILAKGSSRWFFITQTQFFILHISFTYLLMIPLKLNGVGVAFFFAMMPSCILNLAITRRLTGYVWSKKVRQMLLASTITIGSAFALQYVLAATWSVIVGLIIFAVVSIINFQGLAVRLGKDHRVTAMVRRMRFGNWILPDTLFVKRGQEPLPDQPLPSESRHSQNS